MADVKDRLDFVKRGVGLLADMGGAGAMFWRSVLTGTELARATADSVRFKLLKVAGKCA